MNSATAYINSKALVNNYNYLKQASGTEVMGVVKADAYGHGAIGVAKILRKAGMSYLGVATVEEAVALRAAGDSGKILAWLYQLDAKIISLAIEHDIELAIFDASQIKALALQVGYERRLKIHLHVDTGMARGGIAAADLMVAAAVVAAEKNLKLIGIFTHLVSSEIPNDPIVLKQLTQFRQLRDQLKAAGNSKVLFHIANSGGAINYDVADFDFVRSGIALYGVDPADQPNPNLTPVMRLASKVIQVKQLSAGSGIGYGHTVKLATAAKVALVPIGYADGIPRTASGNAKVLINQSLQPILGTISMDQIVVLANESTKPGDEVTIFGDPAFGYPSVIDLAVAAGTISYEVLVRIGKRVVREYV